MITIGHFFAGGGGGILASEVLGHDSILATEINERRCRILAESGWFPNMRVECCDIKEFDPSPWKGRLDCISAGFPCQDISCAGPGAGIFGKRSGLVWHLFKAIDTIQPSIIFLENTPRIRTKGRREIIRAIVERGYSWRDGTLAASHVGAGHKRNRWWCLAANTDGLRKLEQERRIAKKRGWTCYSTKETAHTIGIGWKPWTDQGGEAGFWRTQLTYCTEETTETIIAARDFTGCINWLPIDSGICRVVDGMAHKMDRIKTCGDGQVPLQAAVAWLLLNEA